MYCCEVCCITLNCVCLKIKIGYVVNESEDPYPSLSDFHDYEPNLEFDDTELQQPVLPGGSSVFISLCYIIIILLFVREHGLPLQIVLSVY